jgi:hypothetical protein
MDTCKLCLKETSLQKSHIYPESLYRDLYNDEHQMIGVHGQGERGYSLPRKGQREPLLGGCCEELLNREYETPFARDWLDAKIPERLVHEGVHVVVVPNFANFKLFHLSILLRASWSSNATYSNVSLGPHEDRIRKMVLTHDPGESWQYPIFGYAVADLKEHKPKPMVTRPEKMNFHGLTTYSSIYGGVCWNIGVGSHASREFSAIALQPDGTLYIAATDFRDSVEARHAGELLRRETDRTRQ